MGTGLGIGPLIGFFLGEALGFPLLGNRLGSKAETKLVGVAVGESDGIGNRVGSKLETKVGGAAVGESVGVPVGTSSQSRHSQVAKVGSKNKSSLLLLLLLSSSSSLLGQKPTLVPSMN